MIYFSFNFWLASMAEQSSSSRNVNQRAKYKMIAKCKQDIRTDEVIEEEEK